MVDCSQFLEGYTEFRDGRLEGSVQESYEEHLATCSSCARYHRVVCRGAEVFRDLPLLSPSEDFVPRLQHRIYHVQDELSRSMRQSSSIAPGYMIAIAAALAVAAWIPSIRTAQPVLELPPIAARAPEPQSEMPVLFRSGPLLVSDPQTAGPWSSPPNPTGMLLFQSSPVGTLYPGASLHTASLELQRR